MRKAEILTLALVAVVVLLAACDGGEDGRSSADASPQAIEGGLPPDFPDDFPMYPDLNILESFPLGERYIVRADSPDPVEDIIDFYEQGLTEGRWELLQTDRPSDLGSTIFRFTAPGFTELGSVAVAEDTGGSDRTVVGIAIPIAAGEGD